MTKEELKKIIEGLTIEGAIKDGWLKRVESEELTADFYRELSAVIQTVIDKAFKDAGVELDENNPEAKAAYEKAEAETKKILEKFEAEAETIKKQTAQIQADADKDFSELEAGVIKGNLP